MSLLSVFGAIPENCFLVRIDDFGLLKWPLSFFRKENGINASFYFFSLTITASVDLDIFTAQIPVCRPRGTGISGPYKKSMPEIETEWLSNILRYFVYLHNFSGTGNTSVAGVQDYLKVKA